MAKFKNIRQSVNNKLRHLYLEILVLKILMSIKKLYKNISVIKINLLDAVNY